MIGTLQFVIADVSFALALRLHSVINAAQLHLRKGDSHDEGNSYLPLISGPQGSVPAEA
jgi:hypothetical protein